MNLLEYLKEIVILYLKDDYLNGRCNMWKGKNGNATLPFLIVSNADKIGWQISTQLFIWA